MYNNKRTPLYPLIGMQSVVAKDWVPLPGFPGIEQVVLAGSLDELNRKGRRTRLVRFAPGTKTATTLIHDYHEEAYLVEGSLQVVGKLETRITAPAFVHRPPGTHHGPFESIDGCVMAEMHYFV